MGMIQIAGRRENQCDAKIVLEHAEHDGSDKSDYDIRGDNAQSGDERTDEGHWQTSPWFTSLPALTRKSSKRFPAEKVRAAVHPRYRCDPAPPSTWLKIRNINTLKSL